jgi:hypothetical protein
MRVPAMRRIVVLAICTALAILSPSQRACAHIRSETYSSWVINGSTIYLTFTVPQIEAKRCPALASSVPISAATSSPPPRASLVRPLDRPKK